MQFNFEKDKFLTHNGNKNITKESLNGEYPIYIFYCKENKKTNFFDVLHFDWVMSSSVNISTEDDAKSKIERYNPEWVLKHEINKETKSNTTHLITGYYNLITDEWVEIKNNSVSELNKDNIFSIMADTKYICSNLFFNDKELYLCNLKNMADKEYLRCLDHKDLNEHLDMHEFIEIIINWYQNEKEDVKEKTTKRGSIIVPIALIIQHLKDKGVPEKDVKGNFNAKNLLGLMRAYDFFQTGIGNIVEQEYYNENEFNLIDKEDLSKNMKNYIEISMLSNRFINIFS